MATLLQLARVCTTRKLERLAPILGAYNEAVQLAGAGVRQREAMFLAQLAHESGEFLYSEELASGDAYEGRLDLGNIGPGDGRRYKGRGWIQLTGRNRYARAGADLGLPLVSRPELAALPEYAGQIAAWYWHEWGCNEAADKLDIRACTKLINGGLNGLAQRETYYARALSALASA